MYQYSSYNIPLLMFSSLFLIIGLCVFETVTSIDNAIINAEVLETMNERSKRWFLLYGMFFAVVVVRGGLPWLIVYLLNPSLGPIGALTATFSSDPQVHASIEQSAPFLLMGGGMFLILLFLHWLFIEEKHFGLPHEKFFASQGAWFFACASVVLLTTTYPALLIHPFLAFALMTGSTAFFLTHGCKEYAEDAEQRLLTAKRSDWSKILYLEVIDATFSIDSVLGAFAFTLSVPLILLGNGLGALLVRQLTIHNTKRLKHYPLLKNGAMYSVFILGVIMLLDGFGWHIPEWVSPASTLFIISYFFWRSKKKG